MRAIDDEPLVADSFRVRLHPHSGLAEVRGLHHHLHRFKASVLTLSQSASALPPVAFTPEVTAFVHQSLPKIAAYGEGFPRLQLLPGLRLHLLLRPTPKLGTELALRTVQDFARVMPQHKGPNMTRLNHLNSKIGAEALLLDGQGLVVEGATTSLIWWDRHTGAGYHVEGIHDRVDSVTERLIRDAIPLSPARVPPEVLTSCEVWAVNALHGIRVVDQIDGVATAPADPGRLARVREVLDRSWQPLTAA